MTTIFKGQPAQLTVTVQVDGAPVAIDAASSVSAQLFTVDGSTALSGPKACASTDAGADWPAGVVAVSFTDTETAALELGDVMLVLTGSSGFSIKRFKVTVESATAPTKSFLFTKDFIVEEIRADRLMAAAQGFMGGAVMSDDYIWSKVVAAEAHIAHELRVPLVPTKFFPGTPTADQIAALDGMPWGEDPGYDYKQDMFFPDGWGMIKLNNKPLIGVESVKFDFPTMGDTFFDMPVEWIRPYKKYAHLQFVPSTPALFSTAGTFVMRALTGYSIVPLMVKITYVAGLENAARDYPDLIDAIKKTAVLKAIEDGFPAQSGSISADGLSQSMSVDLAKYHEMVDTILNGPKGGNGGLMTAIHGIRSMVMGG
ncbi:hypothetical protein [Bordetella phage vB_BbrM_PHB04]|uniref:Uncharacterized protein n=1 Tax=Bordetella phage vB_BbrM_PHB04 TaxID=2029657 RepID=A0A291L9V6_9CAUD|nr:tail fiber protein [Bordetella phage vB_BbrM_PHB04]ATI15635.1 hypothetical protein [Bordetella phage vB_BbrM_PHB04]